MPHRVMKAVGLLTAAGAACFTWGLIEAQWYTLRHLRAKVLPSGSPDLRVLHVSDFHLLATQRRKLAFIASLADLEPDLVINTGDNLSSADGVGPLLEALAPLAGTPGVFVFGSNDYYPPSFKNPLNYLKRAHGPRGHGKTELPWGDLRDGLEGLGWVDLNNRRTAINAGTLRLSLHGTDDAHLDRDDFSAVAGYDQETADLRISVTHSPYLRVLDDFTADGTDLIFAGHTHGGQVCIPGMGAVVTNCDLDPSRVKGLTSHSAGGRTSALHVSAGLGTSPYAPYRFACRPEATLLTLTAGQ